MKPILGALPAAPGTGQRSRCPVPGGGEEAPAVGREMTPRRSATAGPSPRRAAWRWRRPTTGPTRPCSRRRAVWHPGWKASRRSPRCCWPRSSRPGSGSARRVPSRIFHVVLEVAAAEANRWPSGAECDRGTSLVLHGLAQRQSGAGVPEAGCVVVGSRQKRVAIWAEGDLHDPVPVRHTFADGQRPGRQSPTAVAPRPPAVDRPNCQRLPVRAKGQAGKTMPLWTSGAPDWPARRRVPEPCRRCGRSRRRRARSVGALNAVAETHWYRQIGRPSRRPVAASRIWMELSRLSVSPVERSWLAVATRVPSGLNATVRTFRPWRSGDPRGW